MLSTALIQFSVRNTRTDLTACAIRVSVFDNSFSALFAGTLSLHESLRQTTVRPTVLCEKEYVYDTIGDIVVIGFS